MKLVNKNLKEMKNEFEMSMIGEMKYFLGFTINKNEDEILIAQTK